MDVYLHAHFILHGVVHNTDAALIFSRHYRHVVSQKFRVRVVQRSGLLCIGSGQNQPLSSVSYSIKNLKLKRTLFYVKYILIIHTEKEYYFAFFQNTKTANMYATFIFLIVRKLTRIAGVGRECARNKSEGKTHALKLRLESSLKKRISDT